MQITTNQAESVCINKKTEQTLSDHNTSIKIVTLLYKNYNYGAVLQAFALWRFLSLAGFDCQQIALKRQKGPRYLDGISQSLQKAYVDTRDKSTIMTLSNNFSIHAAAFDKFKEKNYTKHTLFCRGHFRVCRQRRYLHSRKRPDLESRQV